jgi:uncharacterized repeat protein (TIGR03803 family)
MPCINQNTDLRNLRVLSVSPRNLISKVRAAVARVSRNALALTCVVMALAAAPLRAQSYQDLVDLDYPGGCFPIDYGRLTQGTDGNLYGTTEYGGANNFGTLFKVNPAGTGYTVLWNFDGATTGANPIGGLTLSSVDGKLYGATFDGGTYGDSMGTLFSFNTSTSTLTVLHHFNSTEDSPEVPPAEGKDKKLYGMTHSGTTYRVTPPAGTFQLLPNKVPGIPVGPLLLASDGILYGTTATGGTHFQGTIFRMTTAGAIQTIHNFTGFDGDESNGPLAQGQDGSLYGTTFSDSTNFSGTVFKLTFKPFKLTTLHSFLGADGANPSAGLLFASDGNLYGTTSAGGANGFGTLFEITTGGVFTNLFDFTGDTGSVSGGDPSTTLMEDTNGVFYGLTYDGGANGTLVGGYGVFYNLTPLNIKTHITLCCNWWVILDQPVAILGQGLRGAVSVSFGSVPAQFQPGSDTYLTAKVPSGAIDSIIIVTLATGAQIETTQAARILPKVTNLDPSSGTVGTQVNIVGGGFARTTKVTFGGVTATNFTVVSPALIQATVPTGAVTGKVAVVTRNDSAVSKQTFTVN